MGTTVPGHTSACGIDFWLLCMLVLGLGLSHWVLVCVIIVGPWELIKCHSVGWSIVVYFVSPISWARCCCTGSLYRGLYIAVIMLLAWCEPPVVSGLLPADAGLTKSCDGHFVFCCQSSGSNLPPFPIIVVVWRFHWLVDSLIGMWVVQYLGEARWWFQPGLSWLPIIVLVWTLYHHCSQWAESHGPQGPANFEFPL